MSHKALHLGEGFQEQRQKEHMDVHGNSNTSTIGHLEEMGRVNKQVKE